jgi:hypothetical protein
LQVADNPLPEIAGLRYLLPQLSALPEDWTTEEDRTLWANLLEALPPLPIGEQDGKRVILPAATIHEGKRNSENPELYAVFPYALFGENKPDLQLARDTFAARTHRQNYCWTQDGIHAACLGLSEEARTNVVDRFQQVNEPFAYPAMWKPYNDELPDMDHGGSGQIALQSMLFSCEGKSMRLFPAWPADWDVRFKLHAPFNTTVQGVYKNGTLAELTVEPPERRADLVVAATR